MAEAQVPGVLINEDKFPKIITERSQGKPIQAAEIKKENVKNLIPVQRPSKNKLGPKKGFEKEKDNLVDNKTKDKQMDKIQTEPKSSISKSKLDVNNSKNNDKLKSSKNNKEKRIQIKVEPSSSKDLSQVNRKCIK